jgi:hypothetical protein
LDSPCVGRFPSALEHLKSPQIAGKIAHLLIVEANMMNLLLNSRNLTTITTPQATLLIGFSYVRMMALPSTQLKNLQGQTSCFSPRVFAEIAARNFPEKYLSSNGLFFTMLKISLNQHLVTRLIDSLEDHRTPPKHLNHAR